MTLSNNSTGQQVGHRLTIHDHHCSTTTNCVCVDLIKTNQYKYLGVTIDQHLRWNAHAYNTSNRIRKTMFKFWRLRDIVDKTTLRQVYFSIVQSIAEYGILAWGGAYYTHISIIETAIMRSVLRVAMRLPYDFPSNRLHNDFDVPTLTQTYAKHLIYFRLLTSNRGNLLAMAGQPGWVWGVIWGPWRQNQPFSKHHISTNPWHCITSSRSPQVHGIRNWKEIY